MDSFIIDKPTSDTGYFTLFLKYTALFIVFWIAAWVALLIFLTQRENKQTNGLVFDNGGSISLIIAVLIILYFIKNAIDKYKYGSPFEFSFDDTNKILKVKSVNVLNDKVSIIEIPYAQLKISELKAKNELFGEQRIFQFYNLNSLVSKVNFELTGWCRLDNIDELINKLKQNYAQH